MLSSIALRWERVKEAVKNERCMLIKESFGSLNRVGNHFDFKFDARSGKYLIFASG